MQVPALPPPEGVEVNRLAHLPLGGARLRALAVQGTVDALLPAHDRHGVTVGACVDALVLTMLTGEPAWSRVADPWAGYDLAVMVPRPIDATGCHDNRWGRALEARWTVGGERVYGAVSPPAIRP